MDILLNWLWRGSVVAGAAHLLIWALGPLSPRTRYRVWWSALVLTVSLPLLPAVNLAWMPEVTPVLLARVAPLVSLPDSTIRINQVLAGLWLAWIAIAGVSQRHQHFGDFLFCFRFIAPIAMQIVGLKH